MKDLNFPWKLRRAREHLSEFHEARQWWLESEPYRIAEEIDAEADLKQILVISDRQPPTRMSLIVGDAIQSLRSALDYVVGDLARIASGGYLMPAVEKDLMFPITTSRAEFRSQRRRGRLGCVPPRAQAVIQRVQPYRAQDDGRLHPLWALHQLSNMDKHRRIPLFLSVLQGVSVNRLSAKEVYSLQTPALGPFVDKAVLFAVSPAGAEVEMDLEAVEVDIAFGEGHPAAGLPVENAMTELLQWVSQATYDLRSFGT